MLTNEHISDIVKKLNDKKVVKVWVVYPLPMLCSFLLDRDPEPNLHEVESVDFDKKQIKVKGGWSFDFKNCYISEDEYKSSCRFDNLESRLDRTRKTLEDHTERIVALEVKEIRKSDKSYWNIAFISGIAAGIGYTVAAVIEKVFS